MPNIKRKQAAKPITPDGLWSMKVSNLEIYLDPQPEVVGYEDVETPYTNEGGEKMYADPDGTGQGYFADDNIPAGWVLKTRPVKTAVFASTRGNLSGIQIIEQKGGVPLNLNQGGYDAWEPMSKALLLEMALEDANLSAKHEAFVAAAHAYMVALHAKANS